MNSTPRRLGKYELQEPLGRGGMAEVWKAFDTQLRRPVAIKLMHANLQADPSFVSRFTHEAQVVAALRHPNIVQIYDFHIADDGSTSSNVNADTIAYMVMEYIQGRTLANYIYDTSYQQKIPSGETVVRLFTPISSALDYAHKQGMIHRDIKPANILLDERNTTHNTMGEPILSDFGLAKLLNAESQTMTGTVFGTPLYISPEQVQGKTVSDRSDLYSLAVILYEMFTGVRPFQAESVTGIMLKQINEMPPAPHLVNRDLPPALSAVILKGLAKDPNERYPSASALTASIAQAFGLPVPAELQHALPEINATSQADPATIRATPPASSAPPVPAVPPNMPPTIVDKPQPVQADVLDLPTVRSVEPETPPKQQEVIGAHSTGDFETIPTPAIPAPIINESNRRNPTSSAGFVAPPSATPELVASPPEMAQGDYVTHYGTRVAQPAVASASPALPAAPPPVASSAPVPERRRPRRGLLLISLIVLVCVLAGSGLTAFLVFAHQNAANASVGQAMFVSSGNVDETTNRGANDEFQINLQNIPSPQSGKSYYAWLLPDKSQSEAAPFLLGKLAVSNGSVHFFYKGDGQHTNLLAMMSRFLITEEDANVTPDIPSPDLTTWKYYAELPQAIPSGQQFSLLDHLRHLLTDDPDLQKLHTPIRGGLDIWTLRETQKMVYWVDQAMNALNAKDYDNAHKRIVEMLDYLDGANMVGQDVPAGTPLAADPIASQVGLLELDPNQQPPGYLYHDALHLNGVVQSPGATQYQHDLAAKINNALNNVKTWLGQVRNDAIQLVKLNGADLASSSSLALLKDISTLSQYALSGRADLKEDGVNQIYKNIQLLATFNVTPYKQ